MKEINSYYIKTLLMEYYRFTRQCLCADEVNYLWGRYIADILLLTKSNFVHEIEIKTNKSDLCCAELNKKKHINWNKDYPNYFSFAVPISLKQDAEEIISKLNPKYGLILMDSNYPRMIINKSAKRIHANQDKVEVWKNKIIFRNNSALIGYMKRTHICEESNENI